MSGLNADKGQWDEYDAVDIKLWLKRNIPNIKF